MKIMKIKHLTEKNEQDKILYFGKTKKELLLKYDYIIGMRTYFNKEYLKVGNNNKSILLNKDFQEVLKYDDIIRMKTYFNQDYLKVGNNYKSILLNKDFQEVLIYDKIINVFENYLEFELDGELFKWEK